MDTSIKIPCALIPLNQCQLLLPTSAIAEILYCDELKVTDHTLPWLFQLTDWQNQAIRVIDFEKINSPDQTILNTKNIVVIVRKINDRAKQDADAGSSDTDHCGFFGILAKNTPQIVEANSRNLDRNLHPKNTLSHVKCHIDINHTQAIIPDIPSLASLVSSDKDTEESRLARIQY